MSKNNARLDDLVTVFETVPDHYLILSAELTILTASNSWLKKAFAGQDPVLTRKAIQGQSAESLFSTLAAPIRKSLLASLRQAVETGKEQQSDDLHYALFTHRSDLPAADQYSKVWNIPVPDDAGRPAYIIHKVSDGGRQVVQSREIKELRLQKGLVKEKEHLLSVIRNMPDVVTRWNSDLELIYANSRVGLDYDSMMGKTALHILTKEQAIPLMKKMRDVFSDGEARSHLTSVPGPAGDRYFFADLIPEMAADGSVISILRIAKDVTELKQTERNLQESRDLLQSVFDESPNSICVFDILYTSSGAVRDFKIRKINEFTYKIIGRRNIIGKRYTKEFPSTLNNGLFDSLRKVATTGISADFEFLYDGEGIIHRWMRFIVRKVNHMLVVTTEDITDRKKVEMALSESQELLQAEYRILKQAEEVAAIGSWEYAISQNKLSWSEGMFDLFGLKKNSYVYPEWYLKHVIPTDKPRMRKLIQLIKEEFKPFQDEVTLRIKGQPRTFLIKGTVIHDHQDRPVKVSGVVMDITDKRATELKLKKSEEHRFQDILNAVINALEEERTHIAEVLHNEFGQLLSVAKMKIPTECTEAAGLVNQAIVQVRTIAYELMPEILSDFGLEFALKDMCGKKMPSAGIKCSAKIIGLTSRIQPLMEVAVYRIIQELLNNTIKHSKADKVMLKVIRKDERLHIQLTDNGIGFHIHNNIQDNKAGFGLRYIMNRVHLHKGTLNVSALNRGSMVSIELPLPESRT